MNYIKHILHVKHMIPIYNYNLLDMQYLYRKIFHFIYFLRYYLKIYISSYFLLFIFALYTITFVQVLKPVKTDFIGKCA